MFPSVWKTKPFWPYHCKSFKLMGSPQSSTTVAGPHSEAYFIIHTLHEAESLIRTRVLLTVFLAQSLYNSANLPLGCRQFIPQKGNQPRSIAKSHRISLNLARFAASLSSSCVITVASVCRSSNGRNLSQYVSSRNYRCYIWNQSTGDCCYESLGLYYQTFVVFP